MSKYSVLPSIASFRDNDEDQLKAAEVESIASSSLTKMSTNQEEYKALCVNNLRVIISGSFF